MAKQYAELTNAENNAAIKQRKVFGDTLISGGFEKVYGNIDWDSINPTWTNSETITLGYEIFRSNDGNEQYDEFFIKITYRRQKGNASNRVRYYLLISLGYTYDALTNDLAIGSLIGSVNIESVGNSNNISTSASSKPTYISAGAGWFTYQKWGGTTEVYNSTLVIERPQNSDGTFQNKVAVKQIVSTVGISGIEMRDHSVVVSKEDNLVFTPHIFSSSSESRLLSNYGANTSLVKNRHPLGKTFVVTDKQMELANICFVGTTIASAGTVLDIRVNGILHKFVCGYYPESNSAPSNSRLIATRYE